MKDKKISWLIIAILFIVGVVLGIIFCFSFTFLKANVISFIVIPLAIGLILDFIYLGLWMVFIRKKSNE